MVIEPARLISEAGCFFCFLIFLAELAYIVIICYLAEKSITYEKISLIIIGIVALISAAVFLKVFSFRATSHDSLFEANVEALTQQEEGGGDLGWAGCSTNYTGDFCQTYEVGGVTFYLNYFNPLKDILI